MQREHVGLQVDWLILNDYYKLQEDQNVKEVILDVYFKMQNEYFMNCNN